MKERETKQLFEEWLKTLNLLEQGLTESLEKAYRAGQLNPAPNLATMQWDRDDPEDIVRDWSEHFDYLGVERNQGIIVTAQNAIPMPDTYVAGYYANDDVEYVTEEFKTKAEAQEWLNSKLKG